MQLCEIARGKSRFQSLEEISSSAVKKWKPTFGEVNLENFLGIASIDDASSGQSAANALDILHKCGLLEQVRGKWKLADNWERRRVMLVGDAATAQNIVAWIRKVEKRDLSLSEASSFAEIFLKALSKVMVIPGDWHAGMAMLQSNSTLFFVGLLEPILRFLGWKRTQPDVRKNYFSFLRLVRFVYDELVRVFEYEFMSKHRKFDKKTDDAGKFVAKSSIKFITFLEKVSKGDDEWRKACALFVLMTTDLLEFIDAHRTEDAVGIELGYLKFTPVWEMLRQSKYVERSLHQMETLYQDNPFSRLQEQRWNRCSRRYPYEAKKRSCATDEAIEIWHSNLSHWPMPKTLEGFIQHGSCLMLGERCKRFADNFYNIGGIAESMVHGHAVAPGMSPEKTLIFEVFLLARTATS